MRLVTSSIFSGSLIAFLDNRFGAPGFWLGMAAAVYIFTCHATEKPPCEP